MTRARAAGARTSRPRSGLGRREGGTTSLLIEGAAVVATPRGSSALSGPRQGALDLLAEAVVRCEGRKIVFVGPSGEHDRRYARPDAVLDATGGSVIPGFVDPHTHLPFAGYREGEFDRRLAGESYAEIAASGGGIVATVAATRRATFDRAAPAHRAPSRPAAHVRHHDHRGEVRLRPRSRDRAQATAGPQGRGPNPSRRDRRNGDAGPRSPAGVAPRPGRLRRHRRSGDLPGDRRRESRRAGRRLLRARRVHAGPDPSPAGGRRELWGGESISTPTNCATWEARRSPPRRARRPPLTFSTPHRRGSQRWQRRA